MDIYYLPAAIKITGANPETLACLSKNYLQK